MGAPMLSISAQIRDAAAQIGFVPAIMPAVVAGRVFDVLSHHRLSVLRHHKLPGGRGAQRMIASRLHRFGRMVDPPTKMEHVYGESFAAAETGETYGPDFFRLLEEGGARSSREAMAIPFPGMSKSKLHEFRRLLSANLLNISPTGVIFSDEAARGAKGVRSEVFGVLRRRTEFRPMLGFFERWDSVRPRAVAKFEKDLDTMLTVAGRERLAKMLSDQAEFRAAHKRAYADFLSGNPGQSAKARKAAREAVAAMKRDLLAKKGERA